MERMKQAFLAIPDTVIITDKNLNILDFNRKEPFEGLRKGVKLTEYVFDFRVEGETNVEISGRTYQRKTTAVYEDSTLVGFTIYFVDITDKARLLEQNKQKSQELEILIKKQRELNAELSKYVRQAEEIIDCDEQLRIAHNIHDDAGHAITEIHTISQMCLNLKDVDRSKFIELLLEGISICDRALKSRIRPAYTSLSDLLQNFSTESPFPIEFEILGNEPKFVSKLYNIIYITCKEAHHNTLSHSLADKQIIKAEFSENSLTLSIFDNGKFHGTFKKGFGLMTMTSKVQDSGGTIMFHTVEGEGFGVIAKWREQNDRKD